MSIQAPNKMPSSVEITQWLDSMKDNSGSVLNLKFPNDPKLGWTPNNPNLQQGPAPFAACKHEESFFLLLFGTEAQFARINTSSRVFHHEYEDPLDNKKYNCTVVVYDGKKQKDLLVVLLNLLIQENRVNPNLAPAKVCQIVLPWIEVGILGEGELLSESQQMGLYGELHLLRRLLKLASAENILHSEVLTRWGGPDAAKRDFANIDQDENEDMVVAVEVKTTFTDNRTHRISGVDQLNYDNLNLYVYSLSLTAQNEGKENLIDIVRDICENFLDKDCTDYFIDKLNNYGTGFYLEHSKSYSRIKKYRVAEAVPPALIKIGDDSFAMVENSFTEENWKHKKWSDVQYSLDLSGLEGSTISIEPDIKRGLHEDARSILLSLIT